MSIARYQTQLRVARPIRWRRPWVVVILSTAVALAVPAKAGTDVTAIQFNRDIRPILSDNCFTCHGPDTGSRKAKLRLDTREGLFDATPKRGPVVVPGKPDQSELWRRITTTDPDDVMPPLKSKKELKVP